MLIPSSPNNGITPPETLALCPARATNEGIGGPGFVLAHRIGSQTSIQYPPVTHHLVTIHQQAGYLTRHIGRDATAGGYAARTASITAAYQSSMWEWRGPSNRIDLYLCPKILLQMREMIAEPCTIDPLDITNQFAVPDATIDQIGHALLRETLTPTFGSKLFAENMVQLLAIHLIRIEMKQPLIESRRKGGLDPLTLHRVTDYIDCHLSEDISLHQMAQAADLSLFHFCRSFKQSTGVTPHRYQLLRRIEQAKILLSDRAIPLSTLAQKIGFSSQSHFSTAFRKITGTSPHRYRTLL